MNMLEFNLNAMCDDDDSGAHSACTICCHFNSIDFGFISAAIEERRT